LPQVRALATDIVVMTGGLAGAAQVRQRLDAAKGLNAKLKEALFSALGEKWQSSTLQSLVDKISVRLHKLFPECTLESGWTRARAPAPSCARRCSAVSQCQHWHGVFLSTF